MNESTPTDDLAAQVAHLETLLKQHEDAAKQRFEALANQLVTMEEMIAAIPASFVGGVKLPLIPIIKVALVRATEPT